MSKANFRSGNKVDPREERSLRYKLLSVASRLLPDERVSKCSKHLIGGADSVAIKRNPVDGKTWYHGVQHCSSIWNCPVCNNRITEFRRQELEQALDNNPQYDVIMITYTLRHHRGDKLNALLKAISKSYNSTKSGRFYQELQQEFGIVGSIRAYEPPYGENGWHPHIHELMILDKSIMDREKPGFDGRVHELTVKLKKRWLRFLAKHGRDANWENGLQVNSRKDVRKTYIAKAQLSSELTRMANKKSRSNSGITPFGMLDKIRQGEKEYIPLFQEYAAAFRGSQQLRWSPGLKELLGVKNVEDHEITETAIATPDEPEFEEVATLYWDEWQVIWKNDLRGELLTVASTGGASAVAQFLDDLGIQLGMENWARGSPDAKT